MGKVKVIIGVALLSVALFAGWQVVSCELANAAFQEDLQDLSSQGGTRIGLLSASSEEDIRNTVVRKAQNHDIVIQPSQIIVDRRGTPEVPFVYLAVDYKARVNLLPGFSFEMHFTPATKQM